MTSIDDLILQSTNPFDNSISINFWRNQIEKEPVVESIHTEAIAVVTETLAQVAQTRHTRTLLLEGDPGSGKTYLLGRLKKTLNNRAFFAYINPFPQSTRIWWHILRYTVDSLIQVPEGQTDSQLMLWLKSLSVFTQRSLSQRLMQDNFWEGLTSDRQHFIKHLKKTYKDAGIYNPDSFFGVLYDLVNPQKYTLACEWLRGDDLSDESLKELGVRSSIDTEEAASETLANFGRIATETQPIVLCFDQLESIARLPNGFPDLQTLFTVATKIHGECKNFLLIISITTDTWRQNESYVDQSHKARIDRKTGLKPISLTEAESVLSSRLHSLHRQANPQPKSNIYPINRQYLLEQFPRGKTNPREILAFGRDVIQAYKKWLVEGRTGTFRLEETDKSDRPKLIASFNLKWIEELNKAQKQITKINQQSSPELIQMLQEALSALGMEDIKIPLLKGTKFANHSLSYRLPGETEYLGVVWTEDQNMTTFFHIMEACRKALEKKSCEKLYLLRSSTVGNPTNRGCKVYAKVFNGSNHRQIQPKLASIHSLVAYYELIKNMREGDLIIGNKTINLKALKEIVHESKILQKCNLLEQLQGKNIVYTPPLLPVKELLLNIVTQQGYLARKTLIQNVVKHFTTIEEVKINQLIEDLCKESKIQIIDPTVKLESQLIYLVPQIS